MKKKYKVETLTATTPEDLAKRVEQRKNELVVKVTVSYLYEPSLHTNTYSSYYIAFLEYSY